MAKKDEELEVQAAASEAAVAPTHREKWLENMRAKYPDIQDEDALYEASMNGYDTEHEANKRYAAEANELADIVAAEPSLGLVFNEIFERGKDGHPEMALRGLPDELKRYVSDENYGDEEYLAAKKAREDEAASKKAKDEQTQALREQAFAEVCKEQGVEDAEAALKALQEVFENPCETLEQCKEQVRAFLKMVDYDSAVQAAEIRGKNANIQEQRRNVPTTAPQGGAGVAAPSQKKGRNIFDEARGAE